MIVNRLLKIINRAKDPSKSYGGTKFKFDTGYHSLKLHGKLYSGQRDNAERLSKIPYDFKNKVVLDIGCNIGGILHELSGTIQYGIGIDFNPQCVNAANAISDYSNTNNVRFYVFDLNTQPISDMRDFVLLDKIDICFFLSMTKWVKDWVKVIKFCKTISTNLLIETNGKNQGKQEQVIRKIYPKVDLKSLKSLDDKGQQDRRLFLCGQ